MGGGEMPARLDRDGWELESAVARHERSPDSFQIPDDKARRTLRVGQGAKLLFRIHPDGEPVGNASVERMWVYVTGVEGGAYQGRLQNQSQLRKALKPGMPVAFLPEHIADIDTPPADYKPA